MTISKTTRVLFLGGAALFCVALAQPAGARGSELGERLRAIEAERALARAGQQNSSAWRDSRPARAAAHRALLAAAIGNLNDVVDGHSELALHASHMARLNRILDVAQEEGDNVLAARLARDLEAEVARHARVMQALATELSP